MEKILEGNLACFEVPDLLTFLNLGPPHRGPGDGARRLRDQALPPRGPARLRELHRRAAPLRHHAREDGQAQRGRHGEARVTAAGRAHRPGPAPGEGAQRGGAGRAPEGPGLGGHLRHLPLARRGVHLLRSGARPRHRGDPGHGRPEPHRGGRAPPGRPRAGGGGLQGPEPGGGVGGEPAAGEAERHPAPRGMAGLLPGGRPPHHRRDRAPRGQRRRGADPPDPASAGLGQDHRLRGRRPARRGRCPGPASCRPRRGPR